MHTHARCASIAVACLAGCFAVMANSPTQAQDKSEIRKTMNPYVLEDGRIAFQGRVYNTWEEYRANDFFKSVGRCGTKSDMTDALGGLAGGAMGDCAADLTVPDPRYAPSQSTMRIHVVVHVLESITGQGHIEPDMVQSQIDILNEDFLALAGTPGEPGENTRIEFVLASVDPDGNPTTGILYHVNDLWFNDVGFYYDEIGWDTTRYLNIYSCVPMGAGGVILGYATIPQLGGAGASDDGVRIMWTSFGRNSSNAPYDQGRTATHEVGHYVGLYHTFQDGCGTGSDPGCYSSGDCVCDTNPDGESHGGCPSTTTDCDGALIPYNNYMEYTDDVCMDNFTPHQALRARCTLEHWRPLLPEIIPVGCLGDIDPDAGDGDVDIDDYTEVILNWGTTGPQGDTDGDNDVDIDDFTDVVLNWGDC